MKDDLKKIAQTFNINLLIVFGSAVTGRLHQKSDVDIAYLREKELSLNQELKLRTDLFKIFGKEIDLVFLPNASPLLLGEIAKNGKCIYDTKLEFSKFRIYAMKCFLDFEPYFILREKLLHKHLSMNAK